MPVLEAEQPLPGRLSLLVACLQGNCGAMSSLQAQQQAAEHVSESQHQENRDSEQEADVFPVES
jgi:hypothetical protein